MQEKVAVWKNKKCRDKRRGWITTGKQYPGVLVTVATVKVDRPIGSCHPECQDMLNFSRQ